MKKGAAWSKGIDNYRAGRHREDGAFFIFVNKDSLATRGKGKGRSDLTPEDRWVTTGVDTELSKGCRRSEFGARGFSGAAVSGECLTGHLPPASYAEKHAKAPCHFPHCEPRLRFLHPL